MHGQAVACCLGRFSPPPLPAAMSIPPISELCSSIIGAALADEEAPAAAAAAAAADVHVNVVDSGDDDAVPPISNAYPAYATLPTSLSNGNSTSVSYSLLQPVGSFYPPSADPFLLTPPIPGDGGYHLDTSSWNGGGFVENGCRLGQQLMQQPPPYMALPTQPCDDELMGLDGSGGSREDEDEEEEDEDEEESDPAAELYFCTSDAAAFGGLAHFRPADDAESSAPSAPRTKRKGTYKTWSGQTRGAGTGSGKRKPRRRTPTLAQRKAANIRERKRMYNLNTAFDYLRRSIPTFAYEKHLSRIETLRLAMNYIDFMDELLRTPPEAALAKYANAAHEMTVKWNANVL